MTIEIPDELAVALSAEAARRGLTVEALALDQLRAVVSVPPAGSLLEYLGIRVGAVAGTGESWSQNTGQRFADGLAEDRKAQS